MPRTYVPKPKSYTKEDLENALQEIRRGNMSIREASRRFNIDKSKLSRCISNQNTTVQGRHSVLSTDVEKDLTSKITTLKMKIANLFGAHASFFGTTMLGIIVINSFPFATTSSCVDVVLCFIFKR